MKPPIKKPFVTWRAEMSGVERTKKEEENIIHCCTWRQVIEARRALEARTPELCEASMAQVATSGADITITVLCEVSCGLQGAFQRQ